MHRKVQGASTSRSAHCLWCVLEGMFSSLAGHYTHCLLSKQMTRIGAIAFLPNLDTVLVTVAGSVCCCLLSLPAKRTATAGGKAMSCAS